MSGETSSAPSDDAPVRRRSAGRRVTPERLHRILEAAAAIAVESGLSAVSMQAVAKYTGYVRPVVYDCYGTPENILLTLIDREARVLTESLTPPGAAPVRTGQDFVDRVMTYFDSVVAHPRAWQLLTLPTGGVDDAVGQRITQIRQDLRETVEVWLAPVVEQRAGAADIETLSMLVLAAIDGIAKTVIDDPGSDVTARIRAFLESLVATMTFGSAPDDISR